MKVMAGVEVVATAWLVVRFVAAVASRIGRPRRRIAPNHESFVDYFEEHRQHFRERGPQRFG